MHPKRLLPFFMVLACVSAFPQKRSKSQSPSTTPPASPAALSPSSASGNSQLMTGFHYLLKDNYHVQYHWDSIVVRPVHFKSYNLGQNPSNVVAVFIDSIRKRRFVEGEHHKMAPTWVDTVIRHREFITTPGKLTDTGILYPDTVVTIVKSDSLDRYWAADNSTRVEVVQGDSGKLQVFFRRPAFAQSIGGGNFTVTDSVNMATYNYTGNIPHYAIPVELMDSAQNFTLQVKPQNVVNDPTYYIKLRYHLLQYGPLVIPYKYRFANNVKTGGYTPGQGTPGAPGTDTISAPSESTGSLNLSLYLGYKFGTTKFYYDATKSHNTVAGMISVFAGPSLVALSASNVAFNTDLSRTPAQIIAVSTGLAFSVEWQSFSFGLFSGLDLPLEQNSPWVYKGRPWIGFGVGFNLGMITSANPQF